MKTTRACHDHPTTTTATTPRTACGGRTHERTRASIKPVFRLAQRLLACLDVPECRILYATRARARVYYIHIKLDTHWFWEATYIYPIIPPRSRLWCAPSRANVLTMRIYLIPRMYAATLCLVVAVPASCVPVFHIIYVNKTVSICAQCACMALRRMACVCITTRSRSSSSLASHIKM